MSGKDFDFVVIGGGLIGSYAASELAKSYPSASIALFERQSLQGAVNASSYSAGLNVPVFASERRRELTAQSYARATELPYAQAIGVKLISSLGPQSIDERLLGFDAVSTISSAVQLGTECVQSYLGQHLYLLRASFGKPGLLSQHFLQGLSQAQNVRVFEQSPVEDVVETSEGVSLTSLGRHFQARHAVVCTGPWSAQGPVPGGRTKKVCYFPIARKPVAGDAIIYLLDHDTFLFPDHAKGRWLLSIRSNHWDVDCNSALAVTREERLYAEGVLRSLCPSWVETLQEPVVFADSYADDFNPYVQLSQGRAILKVIGASGSGYRLAPAIIDMILEALRE